MKKNITSFEKIIGVKFKNQNLLLQSLTHKSNNPLNNNKIVKTKIQIRSDIRCGGNKIEVNEFNEELLNKKNYNILYFLFFLQKDLFLKLHHHNIFPFLTSL